MSYHDQPEMTDEEADRIYDECLLAVQEENRALAKELGVSPQCAYDVSYLRTRHRWSEELEKDLIKAHADGVEVNVCDFGVTEKTQQEIQDLIDDVIHGIDPNEDYIHE